VESSASESHVICAASLNMVSLKGMIVLRDVSGKEEQQSLPTYDEMSMHERTYGMLE